MALIKCKECGNSISDKAVECPHCGAVRYPKRIIGHIAVIFAGSLAVGMCVAYILHHYLKTLMVF